VNQLQRLAPQKSIFDFDLALDYGPFEGSETLRSRIAELHSTADIPITAENVIITPGSILANYLILQTICKPGDHIICQYPVFSQLHLLPKHQGIEISLWRMKPPGWHPDIADLEHMIKPETKAIVIK
jgi:aspartate/methionine/tyrosine aminotransferase